MSRKAVKYGWRCKISSIADRFRQSVNMANLLDRYAQAHRIVSFLRN